MSKYNIIRFKQDGENRVIKRGLTLEEAREWCTREATHGKGWFDGYRANRAAVKGLDFSSLDKLLEATENEDE